MDDRTDWQHAQEYLEQQEQEENKLWQMRKYGSNDWLENIKEKGERKWKMD